MSTASDLRNLVKRLKTGDQEAAAELVRAYGPEVQRIVRVHLTDPALRRLIDSMDVCQSVFSDFFVRAALGQYDLGSPTELIQLLATMARHRLIDHARKEKAARRDVRRLDPVEVGELEIADAGETPSQIVYGRELLERFEARLSAEERCLVLARRAGHSWETIAARQGETAEAVRKRYARALDRIANEIDLEDHGDG
jgi:RNA polymerase sigma factor (sigma-70 family)